MHPYFSETRRPRPLGMLSRAFSGDFSPGAVSRKEEPAWIR
ncbi:hypothetical protein CSB85_5490 [Pseudomonas aeruginosa]|nr:hypothetical protein CSB85_5490 [Pseudomonas aeruginosa]AWE75833.1 hypothetical protein CSC31_5100 [Pseudomonas aeruginosa]RCH37423.1 hypothetical protein CSC45_6367 [Pseudomonas aeruginosa]